MIYSALENLISNAWKYSSRNPHAAVEFRCIKRDTEVLQGVGLVPERLDQHTPIYFVRIMVLGLICPVRTSSLKFSAAAFRKSFLAQA